MHGFDDVAAHAEIAEATFGFEPDHPFAGAGACGEPHCLQMLEAADHEAAGFGVCRAGVLGAEIDVAGLVGGHADLGVEPGPALGADIALERGADLVLGLRAEFDAIRAPRPGSAARG